MQIVIDIPKEFEDHFIQDRFEETLYRLSADAHLMAGCYEQETAIMLIDAFKYCTPLPEGHGRLIDADSFLAKYEVCGYIEDMEADYFNTVTPTIIEADKEDE